MEHIKSSDRFSIYKIALIGVMTAIMCVVAPFSIPVGLVPVSFTNFVIFITVIILGWKMGTISYLVYLCVGLVGMPVFSGYSSGFTKLMGPTGGYLIGFIFMAIISGFIYEKFRSNIAICITGMIAGAIITDAFGTAWLAYHLHMSFSAAMAVGVIPFIPGDLIKIAAAAVVGPFIRKQLVRANLL